MPIYDYICPGCDNEFDVLLKSSDETVNCPECNTEAKRLPSACGFKIGRTLAHGKIQDQMARNGDMKSTLQEKYGVVDVAPVGGSRPRGIKEVYQDVVKQGDRVKDQMQAVIAINEEKAEIKQKAWREKAMREKADRIKEVELRKSKERAEKRAKEKINVKG